MVKPDAASLPTSLPELVTNGGSGHLALLQLVLFGGAALMCGIGGAQAARKRCQRRFATFRGIATEDDDESGGEDDGQGGSDASARRLQTLRGSIRADPRLASDPSVQASLRQAEAEVFCQEATRPESAKASQEKKPKEPRKEWRGRARDPRGPGPGPRLAGSDDWL